MLDALSTPELVRCEHFEQPRSCSDLVIRASVPHLFEQHAFAVDHRTLVSEKVLYRQNLVVRFERFAFVR